MPIGTTNWKQVKSSHCTKLNGFSVTYVLNCTYTQVSQYSGGVYEVLLFPGNPPQMTTKQ